MYIKPVVHISIDIYLSTYNIYGIESMYVYIYIYIYIYVYINMYIYTYKYIHIDRYGIESIYIVYKIYKVLSCLQYLFTLKLNALNTS